MFEAQLKERREPASVGGSPRAAQRVRRGPSPGGAPQALQLRAAAIREMVTNSPFAAAHRVQPGSGGGVIQGLFEDLNPPEIVAAQQQRLQAQQLAAQQALAQQQAAAAAAAQRRLALRAQQRAALAMRLRVTAGAAARPNEVDAATFERMAALYSDIHEGSTSLQVTRPPVLGAAGGHEFHARTMDNIGDMMTTAGGRSLVEGLARGAHPVRLGVSYTAAAAHQMSHPDPGGGINTYHNASNGAGTGSDVYHNPLDPRALMIRGKMAGPDTTLFHELTHARHAAQGNLRTAPLTAGDVGAGHSDIGVNSEEYATVGLGAFAGDAVTENAYRRERREVVGGGEYAGLVYAPRTHYLG